MALTRDSIIGLFDHILVSGPKERLFISFALSVSDKVLFLVNGAWVPHCLFVHNFLI